MIAKRTIDDVFDLSVVKVIQRVLPTLKLTKKGAGNRHWACCPFHTEDSASFSVTDDFYKCFGCGAGGNAVKFVMEHDKLSYPEAITHIATSMGIVVEYDETEKAQKAMEKQQLLTRVSDINLLALQFWKSHTDHAMPSIAARWPDFKQLMESDWEMAYGGDEWHALADHLKAKDVDMEVAISLGLVYARKDGTGYVDAYRGRVVFPIRDHRGRLVAFGGRYMGDHKADSCAKYINGPGGQSAGYDKSKLLYGLHIAKHEIARTQRAYLVEGYTDVKAMHDMCRVNSVGLCGTAFTKGHVELLRDLGCTHLVIALDGDTAGRDAARKAVLLAVENNITCSFLTFPEGEDPDSFENKYETLDAVGDSTAKVSPEEVFVFDDAAKEFIAQTGCATLIFADEELKLLPKKVEGLISMQNGTFGAAQMAQNLIAMKCTQIVLTGAINLHAEFIGCARSFGIIVNHTTNKGIISDCIQKFIDNEWEDLPTIAAKIHAEEQTLLILSFLENDKVRKAYADYARATWKCPAKFYKEASDICEARVSSRPQKTDNYGPLVRETDAMESLIDMIWLMVETSSQKAAAEKETSDLLARIGSEIVRKVYADYAKKTYEVSGDLYREAARKHGTEVAVTDEEDNSKIFIPKGVDRKLILEDGIDMVKEKGPKFGIWVKKDKHCEKVSNFTINPLYHIFSYDKSNNRRICEISNGRETLLMEMPSNILKTVGEFEGAMMDQGMFSFDGDKAALIRIKNYILPRTPRCIEISTLGWQVRENIFALADAVYEPHGKGLVQINTNGFIDMDGRNFFLPAFSQLYANMPDGENDALAEDRYLQFRPGQVTFKEYADQMQIVFGDEKTAFGLAWAISCAFRDHLWNAMGNFFPLLYLHGPTQSGKSTFAYCLQDIWLKKRNPYQCEGGTIPAFAGHMEGIVNGIAWFDEVDDKISEDRFKLLMGATEGSGRVKRSMSTSRKKNERDRVNSTPLMSGQFLCSRHDGGLVNRSITMEFAPKENPTPQEMRDFVKLEQMREPGLHRVLFEILDCRDDVVNKFQDRYRELTAEMRKRMMEGGHSHTNRVLQTFMAVVSVSDIVRERLKLPFTHDTMMDMAEKRILSMDAMLSASSVLSEFWDAMEQQYNTMVGRDSEGRDRRAFQKGVHYIIMKHVKGTRIEIQTGKGKFEQKLLEEDTQVIYIRLNLAHGVYASSMRQVTPMTKDNLRKYLYQSNGFLGNAIAIYFEGGNGKFRTTAAAFDMRYLPDTVSLGFTREEDGIVINDLPDIEDTPEPTDLDEKMKDLDEKDDELF